LDGFVEQSGFVGGDEGVGHRLISRIGNLMTSKLSFLKSALAREYKEAHR
jgi:hypothetical protein